jgi:hypothetical protein
MRRAVLLVALSALSVIAFAGATPQSAFAHANCVNHYNPELNGVACGNAAHTDLAGCDRDADSNRVRAWHWIAQASQIPAGWDPNGADSGCAHSYIAHTFSMRACTENEGCSVWGDY